MFYYIKDKYWWFFLHKLLRALKTFHFVVQQEWRRPAALRPGGVFFSVVIACCFIVFFNGHGHSFLHICLHLDGRWSVITSLPFVNMFFLAKVSFLFRLCSLQMSVFPIICQLLLRRSGDVDEVSFVMKKRKLFNF